MPKRVIPDYYWFFMPQSRELQFVAMAVVQAFVNGYDKRVKFLNLEPVGATFHFMYEVAMSKPDWEFFMDIGLELDKQPSPGKITWADAEVDFMEERLARYGARGDKHVAQIYSGMLGLDTVVLPKIRTVEAGTDWYLVLHDQPIDVNLPVITGEDIAFAGNGVIGGVVGVAGWETTCACARGLPVIEIKPPDRPLNFLSKWTHKHYRMVDGAGNVEAQVAQALEDLKKCITVPVGL